MDGKTRVYIAGHRGLVGSALVRGLAKTGVTNPITRTHAELDLTDRLKVFEFFAQERPEYVILAAAKVGGIVANNTYPADFIRVNLDIQNNVIEASHRSGVGSLLFLGSSCIYPKFAPQPLREEYLLTGPLEPTNRPYAVAKIAGIEMCWSYNRQYGTRYAAVMPSNLYGLGDNFDPQNSHVLPALILKAHLAKTQGAKDMVVWGTGTPRRELLYSDDLAAACIHLLQAPAEVFDSLSADGQPPLINVGAGSDISIRGLAELVCSVIGFEGSLTFDTTKPDGTPQKLMDSTRMRNLGWSPTVGLEEGIGRVYEAVKASL